MCRKDIWSRWLAVFVIFMGNAEVAFSITKLERQPYFTGSLAVNDSIQLNEDSKLVFDALNNDKRPTGGLVFDLTKFKIIMPPTNGSGKAFNNGEIEYSPNENFYGRDSLKYEICDTGINPFCETATVFITVFPVNDTPILLQDTITISEDTYAYVSPLKNDQDVNDQIDGLALSSFRIIQKPDLVFAEVAGDSILLVPTSNFFGTSQLTYEVCDNNVPPACASTTVTIVVENVNDAPVLVADNAQGLEETTITVDPLLNDHDPLDTSDQINTASLILLTKPANGSASINQNNEVVYNPNVDFFGSDQLTYQACDDGQEPLCSTAIIRFKVINVNDAPLAVNDSVSIGEDQSTTLSLISNDKDPESRLDPSSLEIIQGPTSGTYVINELTGEISYQSALNFSGTDKLQYRICDLESPALCSTGWLVIQINAENDLPIAIADSILTIEDVPTSIQPINNDSDPGEETGLDLSTFHLINLTHLGNLQFDTLSGTLSFAPHAQVHGSQRIAYEICDYDGGCTQSTILIQTASVNDEPIVSNDSIVGYEDTPIDISILLNDSDSLDIGGILVVSTINVIQEPLYGSFQINPFDGFITYLPNANWNGTETLTYEVCDDQGACGSAEVFITIEPVNDLPNVTDDEINVLQNESICINPLENDDDLADGSNLNPSSFQLLDSTTLGTLNYDATTSTLCFDAGAQSGTYVIDYQVCDYDSLPSCATGSISITVAADSLGIIANDDQVQVDYNQTVEFSVEKNDELISSTSYFLTNQIGVIEPPTSGNLIFDQDVKAFIYQPTDPNALQDSFTYEICNNEGQCDQAEVQIIIKHQNLPPVANNDSYFVNDVTLPILLPVAENDMDPEGQIDLGSMTVILQPQHGTLTYDSVNHTFTYQPKPTFVGQDSFRYEICDSGDLTHEPQCDQGNVYIFNVIDRDFLKSDTLTILEDELTTINFPDSLKSISLEVQGENGSVAVNSTSGKWAYLSSPNYYGADYIQFEACTDSNCFVLPLFLNVLPVNDPPKLASDFTSTELGMSTTVDVLENDQDNADTEGGMDYLSISILQAPTSGTAEVNSVGRISYTAGTTITSDTIVYQACDVGYPNPPICKQDTLFVTIKLSTTAISDDNAELLEDQTITIDVLANDSKSLNKFAQFDFETMSITSSPSSGSVEFDETLGEFVYQPSTNFNGTDKFTYNVCDKSSNCGSAKVSITVLPVNDAPIAGADSIYTNLNQPISFNVTDNDSDLLDMSGGIDLQSASITGCPANGSVLALGNGGFTYTPDNQFFGWETMTYQICDNGSPVLCSSTSINILVQPDRDLLKVGIDTFTVYEDELLKAVPFEKYAAIDKYDLKSLKIIKAVNSGAFDFNTLNGQFSYLPSRNFNGSDLFKYHICPKDSLLFDCSEGTVLISVLPVNDYPVVANDQVNTLEETTVNFTVLDNDLDYFDPQGSINEQSIQIISSTSNGILDLNSDQTFNYQPNLNFVGVDQFTYEVCDTGFGRGGILCKRGTVTINVEDQNDLPTAVNDTVRIDEDHAYSFRLDLNDFDIDSELDIAGITITSGTSSGAYYFNPITAMVTYEPEKNFFGTDRLTYQICEKSETPVCTFADAIILVAPINDAPIARNDSYEVANNRAIEFAPLLNDDDPFDPNSQVSPNTFMLLDQAKNGVFIPFGEGQLRFEPNEFFIGTETVRYQVCDEAIPAPAQCAQATITIKVIEQDNLTQDDYYELTEGEVISYDVLKNDAGPSDPAVSLLANDQKIVTQPSHGSIEIHPLTGIHTYSSIVDFYGITKYTYEVCDDYNLGRRCYQAEVTLNIKEFNQAPIAEADNYQVEMNQAFVGNILANDSDPDGHEYQLVLPLQRQPGQGVLTLSPDGSFSYTPNEEYEGTDSFDYQICDNGQTPLCSTARVTFTIAFNGVPPLANDDEMTLLENTTISGNFLSNDLDPEGYSLLIPADSVQMPSNGSLQLTATGSFTYIPDTDYVGTDLVSYWICNNHPIRNLCSQATVKFIVIPLKEQWLPDAFTPNFDGLNDQYLPILNYQPDNYKMTVFNRWGEMIFVSEDPKRGWVGEYLGKPAATGNYVIKVWLNEKVFTKTIQLIR